MTNKNTYLRTGIIILSIGLLAILINGFLDGYQDSIEKSDQIANVLKENCECEEVNQIIYAKGLQFGKDGFSTEKAEYELVGCKYKFLDEEAIRINNTLNEQIKGFDKFDLLKLEFNDDQNNKTIIIKNGVIQ